MPTPTLVALTDEKEDTEWQLQAACRNSDNYYFFMNEGKGNGYDAKRVCRGCRVIDQCLDFAITNKLELGVFGGMNKRERRLETYRRKRENEFPFNGNG